MKNTSMPYHIIVMFSFLFLLNRKMKYLEAQVSEQKEQMKIKVPEIQKTLQILQHLQVCLL